MSPARFPPLDVSARSVASRAIQGFAMHLALRLRGLLVVPLLARLLGPEGLGVVTLGTAAVASCGSLLGLGLNTGLSVQLVAIREPERFARTWGSGLRLALVVAAAGSVLLAVALMGGVGGTAFASLRPHSLALGLWLGASTLRELAILVPQLRQETGFIAAFNLAVDYGGALLAITLVSCGFGPGSVLWATGVAVSLGVLIAIRRTGTRHGFGSGIDAAVLRSALGVGLPVVPIAFAQWALQSVDNFFLAAWHGEAVVGAYGLAYTLASVAMLLLGTLNLIYYPTATTVWLEGRPRFLAFLERSLRLVSLMLGVFVVGAFLLAPWGVSLLAGERYSASAGVLPWITVAYAIFTVLQLFQFVPIVVTGRTAAIALAYLVMVLINLALNLLLIPRWAMAGAAFATVLSYSAGAILMARLARRALPELAWASPIVRGTAPAFVLAPLAWLTAPSATAPMWEVAILAIVLLATHALLARLCAGIRPRDWELLRDLVRAPRLARKAAG